LLRYLKKIFYNSVAELRLFTFTFLKIKILTTAIKNPTIEYRIFEKEKSIHINTKYNNKAININKIVRIFSL
jgi:hypothetical protein